MDLDEILREVGDQGKYQQLMLWFVFLPVHLSFGSHAYSQLFMSWTPEHWCRVSELDNANVSSELLKYLTVPKDETAKYSQCSMYKLDYAEHTTRNTIKLQEPNSSWPTVPCGEGWIYNRSDSIDRNTIVTKWDLVCGKEWLPVVALTAFNVSGLMGYCLFLFFATRFGKRMIFFAAFLLQSSAGIATAFSPEFSCFVVFRCLVGIAVSAILIAPSSLALEITGVKMRSQVVLLCSAAQSLGVALLAAIAYFIRDWSNLALATSVPFVAFFLYCWVIPESPRWLLASGRYEEIGRLMSNIARTNGRGLTPDYVVSLKRRFRIELALQDDKQKDTGGRTLGDLLSTPNMKRKIVLMIFIWSSSSTACMGLTYYSLHMPGNIHLHFALSAAAEILAVITAALLLGCIGRRCAAFLTCAFGGGLCLLTIPWKTGWMISLIIYTAAKMCSHTSTVIIHIWIREQFPIVAVEAGFNFIEAISLVGPIFVPYIFYQAKSIFLLPMSIFGALQLLSSFLVLFLPETRHLKALRTLHDAEIFGKHWKWRDYFCIRPTKSSHKNGILKTTERRSQSPIFGLLRKRDSFHLARAEGEIEVLECCSEPCSLEEAVKVTVL